MVPTSGGWRGREGGGVELDFDRLIGLGLMIYLRLNSAMPRQVRLQYPGALAYHVGDWSAASWESTVKVFPQQSRDCRSNLAFSNGRD